MDAKSLRGIADNTTNSPIIDCAIRQAADTIDALTRERDDLHASLLEAWEWLSGHRGDSAMEKVEKAETVVSTAAEWEGVHPGGAIAWASAALDEALRKLALYEPVVRKAAEMVAITETAGLVRIDARRATEEAEKTP